MSSTEAEFYVVFEAELFLLRGQPAVRKVRAVRMTKTPPDVRGGEVAVRYKATFPAAAFLTLVPTVEFEIPAGHWTSQPIVVTVTSPLEEP